MSENQLNKLQEDTHKYTHDTLFIYMTSYRYMEFPNKKKKINLECLKEVYFSA